jgi:outer membrane murein-binding lipoprotein Lpp
MAHLARGLAALVLLAAHAASFVPANYRGAWSVSLVGRGAAARAAKAADSSTSVEDLAAANEALRLKVLQLEAEADAAKEAVAKAEASAKVAVERMQGEAVAGDATADSYRAM